MPNVGDVLKGNYALNGDKDTTVERRKVSASDIPLDIRMEVEQQNLNMAVQSGNKSKKDIAWEAFIRNELVLHDSALAAKNLEMYLKVCDSSNELNEIHFELFGHFQDFLNGRNGLQKNLSYAEAILPHMTRTKNLDQLNAITKFYKDRHRESEAEAFYYTLYSLYNRGEGVEQDLNKAATYLIDSIKGKNTKERREELRLIYQKQDKGARNTEDRIRRSYKKVINAGIEYGHTEYADYLVKQGLKEEDDEINAVKHYLQENVYDKAYSIVSIFVPEKLSAAVKVFKDFKENDGKEFYSSLRAIKKDPEGLENIRTCSKEPLSYGTLSFMCVVFNIFYAIYRTYSKSQIALALCIALFMGIIGVGFFTPEVGERLPAILLCSMSIWTLTIFFIDLFKRKKYLSACRLWAKIKPEHPKLYERTHLFRESYEISKRSQGNWAISIPIMLNVFILAFSVQGLLNPPSLNNMLMGAYDFVFNSSDSKKANVQQEEKIENITPAPAESPAALAVSDLSLDGLSIGENKDKMEKVLGKSPLSYEEKQGVQVYKYSNVEAHLKNGKVIFLRSLNDNSETKRGVKSGSSLNELLRNYGNNALTSKYKDLNFYQYIFPTTDNKDGLLNFAVKNDKIEYIEAMLIEAPQAAQNTFDPKITKEVTNIANIYYKAISDGRFQDAYKYMTEKRKKQAGDMKKFAQGHKDTLWVSVLEIVPKEINAAKAILSYKIKSLDNAVKDGKKATKAQIFEGEMTLINSNGKWLIDDMKSKLVESNITTN